MAPWDRRDLLCLIPLHLDGLNVVPDLARNVSHHDAAQHRSGFRYHRLGMLHDHGLGDWCISARHREFGTLNVME